MKNFMDDHFLLTNETAAHLYNSYAKDMPIIDYHCHLNPQEIYENKQFASLTNVWLDGDHYKWRLMRANGIEEEKITGSASDYEKFLAWAKTVPMTIGNPLYHWTHLELKRFFDIDEVLNEQTAPSIWEKANEKLRSGKFGARDLITRSNVKVICTTDDPTDSLEYHMKLRDVQGFETRVFPSFRPDKGLEINQEGFKSWIAKLQDCSHRSIHTYDDLLKALESRARFFHSMGGRLSDHALNKMVYTKTSKEEVSEIFLKALKGEGVSAEEESKYKSYTLIFLGKLYNELGWAMQFHLHALRNNNTKMFRQLGPDTGYDSMYDGEVAEPLVQLLDQMDVQNSLPKTILYSLNPKDNYVLASIIGSFQGNGIPGKLQLGTAWWFNDQREGMLEQMKALSNVGLFSRFIGMLTDSRSFLSYTRHEYFRRLVCSLIGTWVEEGEVPNDQQLLEQIVKGICYENAKDYFSFPAYTLQK
ncbi:glucuronate isomerase [Priestia aryabhattai]|uniref:glucuronate isomerase n=1 Tax=Priestia aryabhattai TaxID=412384 RepID=UPI0008DE215B|nr:glucuronate isomerase [Priestia aryabhattai]MBX9966246.1 glucuronate isomerase [Priestia aryabhattai]MBZ6488246.1 glucuronate isomerase [Priestia aryabhattai]MDH3115107.1 glucuronate isomerase [Priestia aryabhattai]MDH3126000.1 glucuronate isomerase [Priestia aryabhattai]MDH3133779.1 glucuronate isomerase [Priestia aryabhattai]